MKKLTKAFAAALAILVAVGVVAFIWANRPRQVHAASIPDESSGVSFASLGRVQGLTETAEVGAAADGVLKAVYVKEDQVVRKGTLLGEISCEDLYPILETAIGDAVTARQAKARLLRGSRPEEKRVANKKAAAAKAAYEEAKARLARQRSLYQDGQIARAAYDQSVRDLGVAQADFQASLQNEQLVAAPPLPEDRTRADAAIVSADGRVHEAEERIRKCSISAPMDGTVLRVYARPGESFSTVTPRPLFAMADASGRRVKAEIDERDLGKVKAGQRVLVKADGYGDKKFAGTVATISSIMGRKSINSEDPADKTDRDVVEATIDLNPDAQVLPIGLRVTVQFLNKQ